MDRQNSRNNLSIDDSTDMDPWISAPQAPTSSRHASREHTRTSPVTIHNRSVSSLENSRSRSNNLINSQMNLNIANNGSSSHSGSSSRGMDVIVNPFLPRKRKESESSSSGHQGESSSMQPPPSHQIANPNATLRIGPSNSESPEYHNFNVNGSRERSTRNRRARFSPLGQQGQVSNHLPPNQELNNHLTLAQNLQPLSMNNLSSSNPTLRGHLVEVPNHNDNPPILRQVSSQFSIPSWHSGVNQNTDVHSQIPAASNTNFHELISQRVANHIRSTQEASHIRPAAGVLPPDLSARRRELLEQYRNLNAHREEEDEEEEEEEEYINLEELLIINGVILRTRSADHDVHRDMRLDVDNMSYEELLALEERIGDVQTGLDEEKILSGLRRRKYISLNDELPDDAEPCSICQEFYTELEDVGRLNCGHDFHTACIKEWLGRKNLCPICKKTGLA